MVRKYDSEDTIQRILTEAAQLFYKDGFDKTSIQDIANAAGVSKGAIYHHFDSKEEIMNAVKKLQEDTMSSTLNQWINEAHSLNAKETLQYVLEKSLADQELHLLDDMMSSQVKSPEFIVNYMHDCVDHDALLIGKIMRDGMADGSISTDYPEECAEIFLLLMNIWCDPVIFQCDYEKLEQRMKFLQYLMRSLGADIISESIYTKALLLLKNLYFGKKSISDN